MVTFVAPLWLAPACTSPGLRRRRVVAPYKKVRGQTAEEGVQFAGVFGVLVSLVAAE
jgi:hypothetical protein